MGKLEGKVAFITGGARGQGRAIAERFAREGADIVISDVCSDIPGIPYDLATPDDLASTRDKVESLGRRCIAEVADVRDQQATDRLVSQALSEFGHIDIVCPNAGVVSFANFWEFTEEQWNAIIDVNITGVWRTARAVAPHFIERLSGNMILTSSINGKEAGKSNACYVASKHAVIGLMRNFALELGPYNVRVNAVLPGTIHTRIADNPFTREWIFDKPDSTTEEYVAATRNWNLLRGRAALPASAIADAMLWLASDDSKNVTGIELVVDAGHMILPGMNFDAIVDESWRVE